MIRFITVLLQGYPFEVFYFVACLHVEKDPDVTSAPLCTSADRSRIRSVITVIFYVVNICEHSSGPVRSGPVRSVLTGGGEPLSVQRTPERVCPGLCVCSGSYEGLPAMLS